MIDGVIRWSLHNRVVVLAGAIALIATGIMRIRQMPLDVFPDLTAPTVSVITEAHGMAPEEVETLVTFPIESALKGATSVRRVRSATSIGFSIVWVEFDWGADIFEARQIVSEKLRLVQASLPPEVEPPVLAPISSMMGDILFIGLTSPTMDPIELRTLADWDIRRRLLSIPGVSQVVPIGGGVAQFQVLVKAQELVARGVSLDQVVDAVAAANENSSAGFYEQGGQEYLIYGLGRVDNIGDIEAAVVGRHDGVPVLVSDVAEVVIGRALQRGGGGINGAPGVILGIRKQPGVNTLELTRELNDVLDTIESGLPADVVLHRRLLRQADFIETSIDNVSHALRDGSLLVVLIIGIFLLSGRATIITALAIPLSLIVAAIVLDLLGASLNTMTLGGMAIAVGALVDDAIIDVENVVRRLRERNETGAGTSTVEVVFRASKEIRSSIVFATLIIVLVFLPIFFLHGIEGRMLFPLGAAYVVSLGASLVVALTITPVLCSLLLPSSRAVRSPEEPLVVRVLRRAYEPLLRRALPVWPALVLVSLVGVGVALFAAVQAGRTFLPEFNEGALTISVVTAPGTSLEESQQLGRRVERMLLRHPEVADTSRRTGRAELDEHAQSINSSEIEVRLEMHERSEADMLAALREDFASLAGANIVIGQPISHRIDHMISGTRANIAVKIFGSDLGELRRTAERVESVMADIAGVVDLAIEEQANMPMLNVRFDRAALAMYGLQVADVARTIETAFYGHRVSRVLRDNYALDLVVRYPDDARDDLTTIRQTLIGTPDGVWVPLEAVAEIRRDFGPNQIGREDGDRKIVVMCNVGDGEDLGSVVAAIKSRVGEEVALPQGYYIEYGGQFESAESASRTLFMLGILVVIGIFLLLFVALSSVRDALLVMVNLPLALIGGVVGVYASGGVISIASIIGFITLFGIATRNGIMMVTHIRYLRDEEGIRDPVRAVVQGASERLAPILMTALASGLGLLPLALALGEPGSEIQAPMAIVILYGLGSSTVLNMFVVPAMMLRFGSMGRTTEPVDAAAP